MQQSSKERSWAAAAAVRAYLESSFLGGSQRLPFWRVQELIRKDVVQELSVLAHSDPAERTGKAHRLRPQNRHHTNLISTHSVQAAAPTREERTSPHLTHVFHTLSRTAADAPVYGAIPPFSVGNDICCHFPNSICFLFPATKPALTGAMLGPELGLLSPQDCCCFSGTSKPACSSLYLHLLPVPRVAGGHSLPRCWEAVTPRNPQNCMGHRS